jgi:hypothetical protein
MPISGNAQPFNRQQPKKKLPYGEVHTARTKYGMGDNYGSGVKAKIGKMRGDSMGQNWLNPKKLAKPPKSLA